MVVLWSCVQETVISASRLQTKPCGAQLPGEQQRCSTTLPRGATQLEGEIRSLAARRVVPLDRGEDIAAEEERSTPGERAVVAGRTCKVSERVEARIGAEDLVGVGHAEI